MDKEETKHYPDSDEFTNPHPPPAYEHPPVNQYAPSPNYGQANMGYSGPTVVHTMQSSSSGPYMMPNVGTVSVVGTNMVPVRPVIGPKSSTVTCPSCNEQILTRVKYKSGIRNHGFAGILCLLGCWPCVPIPYCVDSCKNSTHYCPSCKAYIGTYKQP